MNEQNNDRMRELLKDAMRPAELELNRDLWPEMLRRLDARAVHLPWFDWALVGLVMICCVLFPGALPGLLYHL
jgi:hypothetical protein